MTATRIVTPTWGQFWDTTDQSADNDDEVTTITLNSADPANSGITVAEGSRITFDYAGTYDVHFSAQLDRSSGSGTAEVDIWPSINGDDIPNSNTRVTISGPASQAKTPAAWNWYITVDAGQYVELRWSTTDNLIILHHEDAQTGPARPAIPSVIVTATRVDA